ncbi:MAG: YkgJ family cysteine cluster protein [Verrucomicrobiales bacterium]
MGIARTTFHTKVGPMSEGTDNEEKIHYQCQRCGNCCRWPGEVPVDDAEMQKIADYLKMPLYDFVAEYTDLRLNRGGLTLTEKPNGECIFLEGKNHCQINDVKPYQCSGFPNRWNFEGWQKACEAIPVKIE